MTLLVSLATLQTLCQQRIRLVLLIVLACFGCHLRRLMTITLYATNT